MDNQTMEQMAREALGDDLFIEEVSKALTTEKWKEILEWILNAWDLKESYDLGY